MTSISWYKRIHLVMNISLRKKVYFLNRSYFIQIKASGFYQPSNPKSSMETHGVYAQLYAGRYLITESQICSVLICSVPIFLVKYSVMVSFKLLVCSYWIWNSKEMQIINYQEPVWADIGMPFFVPSNPQCSCVLNYVIIRATPNCFAQLFTNMSFWQFNLLPSFQLHSLNYRFDTC